MSTNPYWLREGASRRAAQAMNHRAAWAAGDKADFDWVPARDGQCGCTQKAGARNRPVRPLPLV